MNDKLPFEQAFEERMQDLPLPNEDAAWSKMNTLLDKREKPGSFLNGYKLWGIILVLLIAGAGIFYASQSSHSSDQDSLTQSTTKTNDQPQASGYMAANTTASSASAYPSTNAPTAADAKAINADATASETASRDSKEQPASAYSEPPATTPVVSSSTIKILPGHDKESIAGNINKPDQRSSSLNEKNSNVAFGKIQTTATIAKGKAIYPTVSHKKAISSNSSSTALGNKMAGSTDKKTIQNKALLRLASKKTTTGNTPKQTTEESKTPEEESLSLRDVDFDLIQVKAAINEFKLHGTPIPDSLIKRSAFLAIAKQTRATSTQTLRKSIIVSAGVGVHQKIPINGQQNAQYGYNAKSKVSDYIPSVYLRVEKANKWFFQTEFLYGAPQLVHSFAFNRKTQLNYSEGNITTTSMNINKTFYSEVPFTFNYYIHNSWSLGIGGSYSWLRGAIAERTTKVSNLFGQQQSLTTQIVPIKGYTDSFLYNSHTNLLIQTDYQWKRLSFGLRYTRDMQPYIKYTLPDGTVEERRNWSLEFILRLRLWRSSKF